MTNTAAMIVAMVFLTAGQVFAAPKTASTTVNGTASSQLKTQAKVPTLMITSERKTIRLSSRRLLSRKDLQTVTIRHDPAYRNKQSRYQAVPLAHLLKQVSLHAEDTVEFHAVDGFSAVLPTKALLNTDPKTGAVAYLAIEPPTHKWRPLGRGKPSPGPFYLVWVNPERSHIVTEQWPFQIASFSVRPALNKRFPHIVPSPQVDQSVQNGFRVFTKNCFACHTFNGDGHSQMGPDLNLPLSPVEYFSKANLKALIRNPQNLRRWPESKMRGFSRQEISDKELQDLISYFRFMSHHKVKGK